jgi:hypothetical protein
VIYEIRDYHYRPDLIDAYRRWAHEAVPVLRKHLDVVGFWVDAGVREPEIRGSNPQSSPIGHANVSWVIRWESLAARDAAMKTVFAGPDWLAVWAKHPDANGYVQLSSRFMDAL